MQSLTGSDAMRHGHCRNGYLDDLSRARTLADSTTDEENERYPEAIFPRHHICVYSTAEVSTISSYRDAGTKHP